MNTETSDGRTATRPSSYWDTHDRIDDLIYHCDLFIIEGLWCVPISLAFFAAHFLWNVPNAQNPGMWFFLTGAGVAASTWVVRMIATHAQTHYWN